jgi:phosphomannomutase
MNKFIFDVDGTLTPSRSKINSEFKEFFLDFCKYNYIALVTGSNIEKTREQLGEEVLNSVSIVYCCSGSDTWSKGVNLNTSVWKLTSDVRDWLENKLQYSNFVLRTGNHIEDRPGCINFSIIGRNATLKERQLYKEWDNKINERVDIVNQFNSTFLELCAKIGGETGIDIFPKGYDKSQIVKDFISSGKILFFGDRMDELGNDYPLKIAIEKNNLGYCFEVKDWKHTQKILQVMKVMI